MDDVAISVRNLSKRYQVFDNQRARLMHAFMPSRSAGVTDVWALREVGFEVRRGHSVAVIGRNGGGKSTLLQILTGTLQATSGEVVVKGRVSALLELGSGFNPEYTGRDNVMLNGILLGLSRDEVLRRFDEIASFADIGDAIERPVKTYSSGMMMRLAFAVQVLTDPEILVIDEALSVGDFFFQQKCLGYIRSLSEKGVTLLFVSHDMGTVRDLCTQAIYLKEGRLCFAGDTRTAIRQYLAERGGPAGDGAYAPGDGDAAQSWELDAILRDCTWSAPAAAHGESGRLIAVAFYDAQGRPSTSFRMGSAVKVKVAYRAASAAPTHVAVVLRNKFNQVLTSVGSHTLGLAPPRAEGEAMVFEISLDLLLEAGNYSVLVALSLLTTPNQGENLDSSPAIGPLTVQWDYAREAAPFLGMVGLPARGAFKLLRNQTLESHERS